MLAMPMRPRMVMVALAFFGAWLGCCVPLAAQENGVAEHAERYQLRWQREGGAESCVSGAALARHLAQVVEGRTAAAGVPLLLDGQAALAAPPLSYRVSIRVSDAATGELVGERELTTAESKCSALTPAVLLVLAMSVDPDSVERGLPDSVADELRRDREEDVDVWPATTEPAAPAVKPAPVAGAATATSTAAASRVVAPLTTQDRGAAAEKPRSRPDLRAGLAFSAEVQPSLAPGALLGTRVPLSLGWALSVTALAWLPRAVEVKPSPYVLDDGVDFNAVQLAFAACRRVLGFGAARLDGCAGVTGGVRWLSARALANQGNPYRGYWGPELGIGLGYGLGTHWTLDVGVTMTASLRRDRFTYTDHGSTEHTLFEPALFSGRSLLSLGRSL